MLAMNGLSDVRPETHSPDATLTDAYRRALMLVDAPDHKNATP